MIVLSSMGKMPPSGMWYDIGFGAASLFIALWVALPIITKFEKKA